jgi:hypothetical protein
MMHPKPEKREKKQPKPLKRTPIKKKAYTLKRTRVKKMSVRGKVQMDRSKKLYAEVIADHPDRICQETGQYIATPTGMNCSHIASKGAHPEMYYDKRNVLFITVESHQKWETGDRKSMKIYPMAMKILEELKFEYSQKKKIPKFT